MTEQTSYEFRNSHGRVCCRTNDYAHLCDACRQRADQMSPRHAEDNSQYAPPDSYGLKARLAPTPDLDPNYNAATGAPADGYRIARDLAALERGEQPERPFTMPLDSHGIPDPYNLDNLMKRLRK